MFKKTRGSTAVGRGASSRHPHVGYRSSSELSSSLSVPLYVKVTPLLTSACLTAHCCLANGFSVAAGAPTSAANFSVRRLDRRSPLLMSLLPDMKHWPLYGCTPLNTWTRTGPEDPFMTIDKSPPDIEPCSKLSLVERWPRGDEKRRDRNSNRPEHQSPEQI